jgi:hypothetical protein
MASLLDYLLGTRQENEPGKNEPTVVSGTTPLPMVSAKPVAGSKTQSEAPAPAAAKPDVTGMAKLPETLASHQGFNKRVSALASRTSLSPEDVMAEALRFADRHSDAFHEFIYKGKSTKPGRGTAGLGQVNTIVGMMFVLGVLVTLIVIVGSG